MFLFSVYKCYSVNLIIPSINPFFYFYRTPFLLKKIIFNGYSIHTHKNLDSKHVHEFKYRDFDLQLSHHSNQLSDQLGFTMNKQNLFCKTTVKRSTQIWFNFSMKRAFKWFADEIPMTLADWLNIWQFYSQSGKQL